MLLRKACFIALVASLAIVLPFVQSQVLPYCDAARNTQNKDATQRQLNLNSQTPSGTAQPTQANQNRLESFQRLSQGAQEFCLELFTKLSDATKSSTKGSDFMISPFAIWALLVLLAEAAEGNSLEQLRSSLHLGQDQQALRSTFREVQIYLNLNTTTVEVASLQALFTDKNQPVLPEYEKIINNYYCSVLMTPVDFHDPVKAYMRINEEARAATRGLIKHTVLPQDLANANLFLLSSLYFKGQWRHPFNASLTHTEIFYDENGQPMGNVQMMVNMANFRYAGMNEVEGFLLELPYGDENRLTMLIILPKQGVPLNKVVHNVEKVGIAPLFERLAANVVGREDDEVEVFLPKFSTSSDFSLQSILMKMGIYDIFDPVTANLAKMSSEYFVSRMIHTTKIIVNEEGTEAAAVTSAVLSNKATPPKFMLNRPFLYLIIEKSTNLLLFAGQVTNPNNVVS